MSEEREDDPPIGGSVEDYTHPIDVRFKDFQKILDNLNKKSKIICFVDKNGAKRYVVPDGNIVFCPFCKYPMELPNLKCPNCNESFKIL